MTLRANTRMYNLSPAVDAAWRRLVSHVATAAQTPLEVLDHPAPKSVEALWARDDLGLAMMCGWPFHRADPQPIPVAAPIPDAPEAQGRPVYWSDMIVAADGAAQSLEDTFGGVLAWTIEGSHSGYNAPRRLLSPYAEARGGPLYRGAVGPVVTPRGAIDAVLSGAATVAPLDSYFHLLLKRHEPETAARLRRVARTPEAPIPLFVASPGADRAQIARLREALLGLSGDPKAAPLLDALGLRGFAAVSPGDYAVAEAWDRAARAAGYAVLA